MEDGERENSADELEVVEVLGVDRRVGVDLEGVVVVLFGEEGIGGVERSAMSEDEREVARMRLTAEYSNRQ